MIGPHGCKTVEKEIRMGKVYKSWQQDSGSNEKLMSKMIWRFCTLTDNIIYRIEKSRGAGLPGRRKVVSKI